MTKANFFSRLFGKKSQTINLQSHEELDILPLLGYGFKFGTQSKDYLIKAYGENPYVFMVIDRIVKKMVSLDRFLVKKSDQDFVVENSDLESALLNPNSKEDLQEFLYRVGATYLSTGECFVIKSKDLFGKIQYVCPINYNVKINQNTKGDVISYTITYFGNTKLYMPFDVLHILNPDITIDSNNGFSSLRAGRKVYESNNEVWASEASLHRNKGIAGVLFAKGNKILDPREKKELQNEYDSEYTGVKKFGKVKLSSTELGYKQMGMNPTDLQSIQTRIEHLRTICALYNVDPKLFGDPAASTYNNVPEAARAMMINAVLPLANKINAKLISFIGIDFNEFDITWKIDKDKISELSKVNNELSAKTIAEVNAGILTPEQGFKLLYPEGL